MEKWEEFDLVKAREMIEQDSLIACAESLLRLKIYSKHDEVKGYVRMLKAITELQGQSGVNDTSLYNQRAEVRKKLAGVVDFAYGYYGVLTSASGNILIQNADNSIINIGNCKTVNFGDVDSGLEEEKPKMAYSDAQARMQGMRDSMLKVRLYAIVSLTNEGDKLFTKLLKRFGAWAVSADTEDFTSICDEIDKYNMKVRSAIYEVEKGWKQQIELKIKNSSDHDNLDGAIDILRNNDPDKVTMRMEKLTPSTPIQVRLSIRRELYHAIGKVTPN